MNPLNDISVRSSKIILSSSDSVGEILCISESTKRTAKLYNGILIDL
jgi:hypothetical protein